MSRHGPSTEGRRPLSAQRIRCTEVLHVMSDGWAHTCMAAQTRFRFSLSSRRDCGRLRARCGGVRRESQVLEAEVWMGVPSRSR
jgi:hypothetical protein